MANLIGKIILEQFRVDSFIASGGMGAVYRVWDINRNVFLAMKVLHVDVDDDAAGFKSFQREARALQKLTHPNIVPFYGLFQTPDFVFLLERFVDGPNLSEIIRKRKGPLPIDDVLIFMNAVCAALGFAHANNLVHCDVKPGNVMIDSNGQVYLTDFGIVRHAESATTTFGMAGTPSYMAPEQVRGEPVGPATDVYALGIMLFEMLTGQRPFRGITANTKQESATNAERIRYEHQLIPPPNPRSINPEISEELSAVILRALNKNPDDRYQDTRSLMTALALACKKPLNQITNRVTIKQEIKITPKPETFTQTKPQAIKPQIIVGAVLGILLLILSITILPRISKSNPGVGAAPAPITEVRVVVPNNPTKVPKVITGMINITDTPIPTKIKIPTRLPTKTKVIPTPTIVHVCNDRSQVNLFIGASGRVKKDRIALLKVPASPSDATYKEIRRLQIKERIMVEAGPKCYNGSTWWYINTESSNRGWSREIDEYGDFILAFTNK
jgi:serine/threonine protein kinase